LERTPEIPRWEDPSMTKRLWTLLAVGLGLGLVFLHPLLGSADPRSGSSDDGHHVFTITSRDGGHRIVVRGDDEEWEFDEDDWNDLEEMLDDLGVTIEESVESALKSLDDIDWDDLDFGDLDGGIVVHRHGRHDGRQGNLEHLDELGDRLDRLGERLGRTFERHFDRYDRVGDEADRWGDYGDRLAERIQRQIERSVHRNVQRDIERDIRREIERGGAPRLDSERWRVGTDLEPEDTVRTRREIRRQMRDLERELRRLERELARLDDVD
jgi:hypothetical protein